MCCIVLDMFPRISTVNLCPPNIGNLEIMGGKILIYDSDNNGRINIEGVTYLKVKL